MSARLLALVPLLALACTSVGGVVKPRPVIVGHTLARPAGALARIAVAPFYPRPELAQARPEEGAKPADAAALTARFVTEALQQRGLAVIPPSDLELAFLNTGQPVPRQDAKALSAVAFAEFGATAVLLGRVLRYRERSGEAYGTIRPASVAFELELSDTRSLQKFWSGRFDETQQALSADLLSASRYPGGGTRWLSAAELARWGAGAAADSIRSLRVGP